jgi:hypothetical protein
LPIALGIVLRLFNYIHMVSHLLSVYHTVGLVILSCFQGFLEYPSMSWIEFMAHNMGTVFPNSFNTTFALVLSMY